MIDGLSRRVRGVVLRLRHLSVNWPRRMIVCQGVRISATNGGMLSFGDRLTLDAFAQITVKYGVLSMGSNGFVGVGAIITCRESIRIGNDVLIAEHVTIRDQDHRFGGPKPTALNGFETAPVTIGDNVWIGAKATITKGVSIGSNCVIGAGAVVTSDIPANSVAVGVPARVIRSIDQTN